MFSNIINHHVQKINNFINENKTIDIFKYFAEHNIDINKCILEASRSGHLNVVKYCVENGADINKCILEASSYGHLDVVEYLHQNGGDVNSKDGFRVSAIAYASSCGYLDIVEYLHQNGADIHENNNEAISSAAKYGHLKVIKYLHQNGGDLDEAIKYADVKIKEELISYKEKLLIQGELKEIRQKSESKNAIIRI